MAGDLTPAAGEATGNAIDSMVLFVRSAGSQIGESAPVSSGSGSVSDATTSHYPNGGVASGDGTFLTAPAALAAGPLPVIADPPADTVDEGTLAPSRAAVWMANSAWSTVRRRPCWTARW